LNVRTSIERSQDRAVGTLGYALVAAAACLAALPAAAQKQTDVPRTRDGHVDFNGQWDNGAGIDFVQPQQRGASICVAGCPPPAAAAAAGAPAAGGARLPPPSKPEYRPELAAKVADLAQRQVETDPVLRCFAPGVPRIGPPDQIVQQANQIVFLYDDVTGNYFRVVPMDGKPRQQSGEDTYLGQAVGHWDGDTLVVETSGFNDETWLTDDGAFHTKDLKVVERIKRTGDSIEWSATAYDPAVLVKPWEVRTRTAKATNEPVAEAAPCIERDLDHVVDGTHHANPR
jgi:hypothetical protein